MEFEETETFVFSSTEIYGHFLKAIFLALAYEMNLKEIEEFRFEECESENENEFCEEAKGYYYKVYFKVSEFIPSQFQCVFLSHAPYIKSYLHRNKTHAERASDCIIKTYEILMPYWGHIQFEFHFG